MFLVFVRYHFGAMTSFPRSEARYTGHSGNLTAAFEQWEFDHEKNPRTLLEYFRPVFCMFTLRGLQKEE